MDTVGKILGESRFSTQFNDTLVLMAEILKLKNRWFHDVQGARRHERNMEPYLLAIGLEASLSIDAYWHNAISSLLVSYEKKYGKNNGITDRLWQHIPRGVSGDYWADIRSDLLLLALQAIKSGKLHTGEDSPEMAWTFSGDLMNDPDYMTTTALKAIADAAYDGDLEYVQRYVQYVARARGFN